jgi:hypothetical protein
MISTEAGRCSVLCRLSLFTKVGMFGRWKREMRIKEGGIPSS